MSYRSVILTVFIFLAHTSFAADGVATGNGSLLTGVKFELSAEHPQHSNLFKLIESKTLPFGLREAMLIDLSNVSIMYSEEDITYKDLQNEIRLQLISKTKKTETENGQTKVTEIEEYKVTEEINRLGLFYHIHGEIKSSNFENSPLAAITNTWSNQVIYFTPSLRKLSAEEQMLLVLHEQAHRLRSILGSKSTDERFVEGWARSLLSYLKGKTSQADFYKILKANGIPTYSAADAGVLCKKISCFPNETYVSGTEFYSDLTVVLRPDDIVEFGVVPWNEGYGIHAKQGSMAKIILKSSAFKDYPLLSQKPYGQIEMKISQGDTEKYELIQEFVNEIKSAPQGIVVPIRVRYNKYLSESGTEPLNKYSNIEYEITAQRDSQLDKRISEVFGPTLAYDPLIHLVSEKRLRFQKAKDQLLIALNRIESSHALKYAFKSGGLWFSSMVLSTTGKSHIGGCCNTALEFVKRENGSTKYTIHLSLDDIDESIFERLGFSSSKWAIRTRLGFPIVSADDQILEEQFYDFVINQGSPLLETFFQVDEIRFQEGIASLEVREDAGTKIILLLPHDALLDSPYQLLTLLQQTVFNRDNYKDYVRGGYYTYTHTWKEYIFKKTKKGWRAKPNGLKGWSTEFYRYDARHFLETLN